MNATVEFDAEFCSECRAFGALQPISCGGDWKNCEDAVEFFQKELNKIMFAIDEANKNGLIFLEIKQKSPFIDKMIATLQEYGLHDVHATYSDGVYTLHMHWCNPQMD